MLPNDPVFRFMNYHVRVFVKRYYHLRVFFKMFALALFSPDWTPLSGYNGSTPPPGTDLQISRIYLAISTPKRHICVRRYTLLYGAPSRQKLCVVCMQNHVWCVCSFVRRVCSFVLCVCSFVVCVCSFVLCVCSFCGVCMQFLWCVYAVFLWCVFAHLCRVCMQFLIVLTLTFVKTSHLCGIWVCAGKHTGPMPRDGRT